MNRLISNLIRRAGSIIAMVAGVAVLALSQPAAAATPPTAPLTADSVFVELPHTVLEILSRSTRLDMLDYYRADSLWEAPNLVDGTSRLELVTADYLKVRLTDVSTLQIKILPLAKGGDIAAVSYTIDSTGSQGDSQLFFFDRQMHPIADNKIMRLPEMKHFFKIEKGSLTSMKEIEDMVKFPTITYSFSPDNTSLTADLTVGQFMDPDDFNIVRLFMVGPLTYTWTGKKYELKK